MQLHNNILKSHLRSSEILQITIAVCISYFDSNKYHNSYTVQECDFILINSTNFWYFQNAKIYLLICGEDRMQYVHKNMCACIHTHMH